MFFPECSQPRKGLFECTRLMYDPSPSKFPTFGFIFLPFSLFPYPAVNITTVLSRFQKQKYRKFPRYHLPVCMKRYQKPDVAKIEGDQTLKRRVLLTATRFGRMSGSTTIKGTPC